MFVLKEPWKEGNKIWAGPLSAFTSVLLPLAICDFDK
jgi:hypothetical protein